jgi:iron complex transport system substrate-binding protein
MMVAKQVEVKLQSIRTRVSKYPKPKVLLVLGREPDAIRNVYASGGIGFLNDMVTAAGGINVFAHIQREAVRPTAEGVLAASPDVIIEIRAEGLLSPTTTSNQPNVWNALSAIPAVQKDRVYFLTGSDLVVPGPRVAKATERLARTLHPAAFK